jgi:hypothetical protein
MKLREPSRTAYVFALVCVLGYTMGLISARQRHAAELRDLLRGQTWAEAAMPHEVSVP